MVEGQRSVCFRMTWSRLSRLTVAVNSMWQGGGRHAKLLAKLARLVLLRWSSHDDRVSCAGGLLVLYWSFADNKKPECQKDGSAGIVK